MTENSTNETESSSVTEVQSPEKAQNMPQPQSDGGHGAAETAAAAEAKKKNTALRFTFMTVGSIMMGLSVALFQTPNKFTIGGVGGLSIVISNYTSSFGLTQSYVMIIINVILFIIGFILIGRKSMVRTIYCTVVYNILIWILEYTNFIGVITGGQTTLTGEPFLELVYAVLLMGIGGALIFNSGSSSGGTDIVALILKKYTKINVGMALMIVDLTVAVISIFVFTSVEIALFSLMGLFTKSFLLDGVIESLGKTKYLTIITKNHELISPYILKVINHGYTVYDAEGGYTGEKKKVIITVCKRSEALRLKLKLKQLDPQAFVIISDANEILGKGFGGTM